MALDVHQREEIVKMYRAGAKTADITRATGAARSSIYFVLREEGVTPTRHGRSPSANVPSGRELTPSEHTKLLDWALTRVTELENENGALRERIRAGRAALDQV